MERNLRRLKNKVYPKRPQTAAEIISMFEDDSITDEYAFNLSRTERFYIETVDKPNEYSFSVFASLEAIDIVKNKIPAKDRKYLTDATFKICPYGCWYQLLIIYIEYQNDVSF